MERVKMTFSGRPYNIIISNILWMSFNKFYANIEAIFYGSPYMFTHRSMCLAIVNIKKKTDVENHFKKHAQKFSLQDVSVTLLYRRQKGYKEL